LTCYWLLIDSVPVCRSNPNLTSWWLQHHLLAAVTNRTDPAAAIDGVHFDCECGNDNGIAPENMPAFNAAAVEGFGKHLDLFAEHKKMSIAWTGEQVSKASCSKDMAQLHSIYSGDPTQTFQLKYNNDPSALNQTLAAFLILRSDHALLEFGVIGPYECASEPCGCGAGSIPGPQCRNPHPGGGYGMSVFLSFSVCRCVCLCQSVCPCLFLNLSLSLCLCLFSSFDSLFASVCPLLIDSILQVRTIGPCCLMRTTARRRPSRL
jgi:hypothetical protein